MIVDKNKLSTKSINKNMDKNVRNWGYTQSYPHYPHIVIPNLTVDRFNYLMKKQSHVLVKMMKSVFY